MSLNTILFVLLTFVGISYCANPCLNEKDGKVLPYERNPVNYLICYQNEPILMVCEDGLEFDVDKNICKKKEPSLNTNLTNEDSNNEKIIKFCKNLPDDILLPYSANCNEFYMCIKGVAILKQCPSAYYFSSREGYCVPSEKAECVAQIKNNICKDKQNGEMIPHSDECEKFYICTSNKVIERFCPNGLHFSLQESICTSPKEADCEQRKICKNQSNGELVPDPKNCINYYLCLNEEARLKECPNNLHFSIISKRCTAPELAGCDSTLNVTIQSTTANIVIEDEKLNYCQNLPDGTLLPYSTDCSEFYMCNNGIAFLKRCTSPLVYNTRLETCTEEEKGECLLQIKDNVCKDKPDGKMLPHPEDCGKFFVCVFDQTVEKFCPSGLHFSPNASVCTWPEDAGCEVEKNICKGKPNGELFPEPKNCTIYYLCLHEEVRQKECPLGLHFSPTEKHCMLPELAGCEKLDPELSKFCQNLTDGTLLPYSTNCSEFYICINGTALLKSCAPSLHYSTREEYCVLPEKAECTPEINDNICKDKPDGKMLPHLDDCEKFFICVLDKAIEKFCPSGLHFSANASICTWPEDAGCEFEKICRNKTHGEHVPDPKNCSNFYLCVNKETLLHECPHDLHFSPTEKHCMLPELAGCEKIEPEEPKFCQNLTDGTLLQYGTNCSEFHMCINGTALLKRCVSPLHYSTREEYCMSQEKAECEPEIKDNICKNKSDGKLLPHLDDCEKFYVCVTDKAIEKFCPSGLHFSANASKCTWPKDAGCEIGKICHNKINGEHVPDPKNCSNFYLCTHEEALSRECPHDLHFSPTEKHCMLPELAGCEEIEPEEPKFCQNLTDGTLLQYGTNCSEFHMCINGTALLKRCVSPLHYSTREEYCVSQEKAECKPEIKDNICKNKSDGKLLPHPDDCEKYFVCVTDKAIEKFCPSGLHFSPNALKCTWPKDAGCEVDEICNSETEGEHFPDSKNCSNFYVCINKEAKLKQCPSGLHFSPARQYCMLPESAGCDPDFNKTTTSRATSTPLPPITTSSTIGTRTTTSNQPTAETTTLKPATCKGQLFGTHIKHPTDCTKYIVCSGGGIVKSCSSPLEFNQKLEVCDWPERAGCTI